MSNNLKVDPLYIKFNQSRQLSGSILLPTVSDLMGSLSVTSQFKLSMHLAKSESADENNLLAHLSKTGVLNDRNDIIAYDFFCSDASLPGVSFNSVQEVGSRQGVVENFPTMKIYPPFEATFYVDNEFKIIRLFEEWINFISPLYSKDGGVATSENGMGSFTQRENFFRLRYPDEYKRTISVTKFERNFRVNNSGTLRNVPSVTYRLIDAYPDQLNSIPVTYEGSILTKTTVRFLYSRFVLDVNKGNNLQSA